MHGVCPAALRGFEVRAQLPNAQLPGWSCVPSAIHLRYGRASTPGCRPTDILAATPTKSVPRRINLDTKASCCEGIKRLACR